MDEDLHVMRGMTYRLQHMVKPVLRHREAVDKEEEQASKVRFMQIESESSKLDDKYTRNKTAQGNVAINFDVMVELEDRRVVNIGFEFIPTNPPKIIMKMVRRVKNGTQDHFIPQKLRTDWEVPEIAKTISQYAIQDLKIKNDPKVRGTYMIGKPYYIENGFTFDEQPTIF